MSVSQARSRRGRCRSCRWRGRAPSRYRRPQAPCRAAGAPAWEPTGFWEPGQSSQRGSPYLDHPPCLGASLPAMSTAIESHDVDRLRALVLGWLFGTGRSALVAVLVAVHLGTPEPARVHVPRSGRSRTVGRNERSVEPPTLTDCAPAGANGYVSVGAPVGAHLARQGSAVLGGTRSCCTLTCWNDHWGRLGEWWWLPYKRGVASL